MNHELISWILAEDDPSLRYRTLTELLERDERDAEVNARRAEIPSSGAARKLLGSMHPEGYWLQNNPRTGMSLGAGVAYGSFATTHFCLAYLFELGLDRSTPQIERAAERYLGLQGPDGYWNEEGWYRDLSCHQGYTIRTFCRLGYREDPRIQRAIGRLLDTVREDGGYLCAMHERRYKTRQTKSCIRGSVKALLCFSELPELHTHPRVGQLVQYFLRRGGIYRTGDPTRLVNADMERPSFPLTWRANAWEILYALSRLGHGEDPRLERAWRHLESMTDQRGAVPLAWSPAQCPWKVGRKGEANRWLTFYALAAARHRGPTGAMGGPWS
jgi:hypothetical protein